MQMCDYSVVSSILDFAVPPAHVPSIRPHPRRPAQTRSVYPSCPALLHQLSSPKGPFSGLGHHRPLTHLLNLTQHAAYLAAPMIVYLQVRSDQRAVHLKAKSAEEQATVEYLTCLLEPKFESGTGELICVT